MSGCAARRGARFGGLSWGVPRRRASMAMNASSACWQGVKHGSALLLLFGGAVFVWRGFYVPELPPIIEDPADQPTHTLRSDSPMPTAKSDQLQGTPGQLHPTPRQRRRDPHDPKHFTTSADGSKPMPRLALRMCSHLLLQMHSPGRVPEEGPRRKDCAFFATGDEAELEALDDHTAKHRHKSRDAAGSSLCGVVHKVLVDHKHIRTIRAVTLAPQSKRAATIKSECEALFSHQGGSHYGVFKEAFVLNKVDL